MRFSDAANAGFDGFSVSEFALNNFPGAFSESPETAVGAFAAASASGKDVFLTGGASDLVNRAARLPASFAGSGGVSAAVPLQQPLLPTPVLVACPVSLSAFQPRLWALPVPVWDWPFRPRVRGIRPGFCRVRFPLGGFRFQFRGFLLHAVQPIKDVVLFGRFLLLWRRLREQARVPQILFQPPGPELAVLFPFPFPTGLPSYRLETDRSAVRPNPRRAHAANLS